MNRTLSRLRKPFGTAKWAGVIGARYLAWEDAFEVEFDDGLTFLEPHSTVRKSNHVSRNAQVERVTLDEECHDGFFVHYDTGEKAEIAWDFIRELPPTAAQLRALRKPRKAS